MSRPVRERPVLVAGVGNVFRTDDGLGPEVARRLLADGGAGSAHVVDYGVRGLHLAFDLLDGWDALVLVDALPPGERPGRVRVLAVDDAAAVGTPSAAPDPHGMDPVTVLATMRRLGGSPPPTWVVGCAPASLEDGLGLTPVVAAAVPQVVQAVRALLAAGLPGARPAQAGVA